MRAETGPPIAVTLLPLLADLDMADESPENVSRKVDDLPGQLKRLPRGSDAWGDKLLANFRLQHAKTHALPTLDTFQRFVGSLGQGVLRQEAEIALAASLLSVGRRDRSLELVRSADRAIVSQASGAAQFELAVLRVVLLIEEGLPLLALRQYEVELPPDAFSSERSMRWLLLGAGLALAQGDAVGALELLSDAGGSNPHTPTVNLLTEYLRSSALSALSEYKAAFEALAPIMREGPLESVPQGIVGVAWVRSELNRLNYLGESRDGRAGLELVRRCYGPMSGASLISAALLAEVCAGLGDLEGGLGLMSGRAFRAVTAGYAECAIARERLALWFQRQLEGGQAEASSLELAQSLWQYAVDRFGPSSEPAGYAKVDLVNAELALGDARGALEAALAAAAAARETHPVMMTHFAAAAWLARSSVVELTADESRALESLMREVEAAWGDSSPARVAEARSTWDRAVALYEVSEGHDERAKSRLEQSIERSIRMFGPHSLITRRAIRAKQLLVQDAT